VAIGLQAAGQQGGDFVQYPTEIRPPAGFRLILPQQVYQVLAGDGMVVDGQVAQERERLAGSKAAHRLSVLLDLDGPQKPQTKGGLHVPFSE
jgi:hypothetical protein